MILNNIIRASLSNMPPTLINHNHIKALVNLPLEIPNVFDQCNGRGLSICVSLQPEKKIGITIHGKWHGSKTVEYCCTCRARGLFIGCPLLRDMLILSFLDGCPQTQASLCPRDRSPRNLSVTDAMADALSRLTLPTNMSCLNLFRLQINKLVNKLPLKEDIVEGEEDIKYATGWSWHSPVGNASVAFVIFLLPYVGFGGTDPPTLAAPLSPLPECDSRRTTRRMP
jgi:hypothetical protein